MNEIKLGTFKVESGEVRISDPCYAKDTWCAGVLKNVKKGTWIAKARVFDEGSWGERIGYLIAVNEDYRFRFDDPREDTAIDVGVDSGQAGIFDEKYYKDDSVFADKTDKDRKYKVAICPEDIWYSFNCDVTLFDPNAGVIPFGCVSSSGYGDGIYNCSVIKEKGEIVAIVIDYGLENREEDEEDEEEDYDEDEDEEINKDEN
jgi:hypothetical protein